MKSFFHSSESFDSNRIQINSDLEKKSKPPRSDKKISEFKIKFISFHIIVGAISFISILHICSYYNKDLLNYNYNLHYPPTCSGGYPSDLYNEGFQFDFYVLLSENETNLDPETQTIWTKRNLTYGIQSIFSFSKNVSISEVR